MKKVLFVCLGNICRSPMAEGIFRQMIIEQGLGSTIEADSAGTSDFHTGELPDKRARKTCEENGIVLTHLARVFTKNDFDEFDYILAMDEQNLADINKLNIPGTKAHVSLMRKYDLQHKDAAVPDPYFGGIEGFTEVYEMLEKSCRKLLEEIQEK